MEKIDFKKISRELKRIRRTIHSCPELGNNEFKTTLFIEKILKSYNIRTIKKTETGIVGLIRSSKSENTRCIALRADIDALPVSEQTGKKYASKKSGVMHACGHDANTTIVLGTAMMISYFKDELPGGASVKFIFQPDEESGSGARCMIKNGVLENPQVDAIIGIHVFPFLKTGVVGIKYGKFMSAVDKFEIIIYGGGGHAAYPHKCKDTILCSAEIIQSLNTIVSRRIDPTEPAVVTVASIKGESKFNIIADRVIISGTVRTLNENLHNKIPVLIKKYVHNIVNKYDLKFDFKYDIIGKSLINEKNIADLCMKSAKKLTSVKLIDRPSMGGEDFAEYLEHVPGCFIYIGSRKNKETGYPWHHPKFDIDEDVLLKGSLILKEIVFDYFKFNYRR